MIVPSSVQQCPLVCTSRILATCIAQSGRTIDILINFCPHMRKVNDRCLHGEVRDLITMMNNTPLIRELEVGKGGIVRVTSTGLAKVYH